MRPTSVVVMMKMVKGHGDESSSESNVELSLASLIIIERKVTACFCSSFLLPILAALNPQRNLAKARIY